MSFLNLSKKCEKQIKVYDVSVLIKFMHETVSQPLSLMPSPSCKYSCEPSKRRCVMNSFHARHDLGASY